MLSLLLLGLSIFLVLMLKIAFNINFFTGLIIIILSMISYYIGVKSVDN